MRLFYFFILSFFIFSSLHAQIPVSERSTRWVDSVMKTLSREEKIAQLMVMRMSQIDPKTKKVVFYDKELTALIKKYNIGGICLFQGDAAQQATIVNALQAKAKTPLLVCIDAEWGVGMRLTEDVQALPKQMMLGAMSNTDLVYQYAKLVAEQCKRLGVQVNYAPVVDVNNNANNPVINDRSFGESKYKVADFGIAYMKGLQENGVMATAKHFPGHGDVAVDSHYDLPVINKSILALDSLELYPFKKIFEAGVSSVMVAHLYIPAIDNTPNRATSLSPANINELMRNKLGYQGLTFTDGLEMQGVQKYYPGGAASVQSIIAGNDMLCLPGDVPGTISKVKIAIKNKQLTWADIDMHCRKVLAAKYAYGLSNYQPVAIPNIDVDLNIGILEMKKSIAEEAITLVKNETEFFPVKRFPQDKIAYVAVGITQPNEATKQIQQSLKADVFFASSLSTKLTQELQKYTHIIIGLSGMSRSTASNFGVNKDEIKLVNTLSEKQNAGLIVFGNPYVLKHFCNLKNVIVTYEDDTIIQSTVAKMITGDLLMKGRLPVTVCPDLKFGTGITSAASAPSLKKKP